MSDFLYISRDTVRPGHEEAYWNTLIAGRLVQARFFETPVVSIKTIQGILDTTGLTFYAFDQEAQKICGEFTLCNWLGLAAQIHFSLHPEYFGNPGVELAKQSCDWAKTIMREGLEYPLVDSFYGITPVTNKLAIRFIQKAGFDIKFVLPNALFNAVTEQYVDAAISMRS